MKSFHTGSKTPAEWDITDKLKKGENTVALEVYRWSAGENFGVENEDPKGYGEYPAGGSNLKVSDVFKNI